MAVGSLFPIVVLISGSGSNLQAIIDRAADGSLPVQISAVVSNEAKAFGLERAARAGIPTRVLDHRGFPTRDAYDQALGELLDEYQPGLVVLAGFMRILTPALVARWQGRMLNIHPSLLPKYRGLHTHQRVLLAGDRRHGASVHFVTQDLDGGPLILQVRVPVEKGDDADGLAARVLRHEHRIYPQVIRWFAEGRLRLTSKGQVVLDGGVLVDPVRWTDELPEQTA
jgi:phosphoribosylglycinamide formyltransferase-1